MHATAICAQSKPMLRRIYGIFIVEYIDLDFTCTASSIDGVQSQTSLRLTHSEPITLNAMYYRETAALHIYEVNAVENVRGATLLNLK
jgi:hypothetical protein